MSESKKKSTSHNPFTDLIEVFLIAFGHFILLSCRAIIEGLRKTATPQRFLHLVLVTAVAAFLINLFDGHLYFLHWLFPKFFDDQLLRETQQLGFFKNFLGSTAFLTCASLWGIGIIPLFRFAFLENAINSTGLKNAIGTTPKVISYHKLDEHRKVIKVCAPGIGLNKIKGRHDELQSSFGKNIEEIRAVENPKYVEIVLSDHRLPSHIKFKDHAELLGRHGDFLVGESQSRVITENISKLPHLLIAGTTGGGKSQFFKQLLTGLLKSGQFLQIYLIDLKGGLEFRAFKKLPNVKLAKTIEESVSLLKKIKKEMNTRFNYLEGKGLSQVIPETCPFDRIIIGIDEASVLYTQGKRNDIHYDLISEARNLTESIAKLGRAAAIHLILATQKVSKESIDTRIQENISGRMCFKTGTPEGSVRVLGNAKASHLPATPGRGIWQFGHDEFEVQTPYLSDNDMGEILQEIEKSYQTGHKRLKQELREIHPNKTLPSFLRKKISDEEAENEHIQ